MEKTGNIAAGITPDVDGVLPGEKTASQSSVVVKLDDDLTKKMAEVAKSIAKSAQ